MKSFTLLKVISVLPRNWNCDSIWRYSKPPLSVCVFFVQVAASLNEMDRGLKFDPVVDEALDARISRPLRATPVVPRASMLEDVTVPESETPTAS
jgi:hypothetical protein